MAHIPITIVGDPEELIRRIPASTNCYKINPAEGNRLILSASAFNDRDHKPSVDRRFMRQALEECQNNATDGLVKIVAGDVRLIRTVQQIDPTTNKAIDGTFHAFDPIHCPICADSPDGLPENPAHCQIESTPPVNASRFKKLKEALARIAQIHGWLIPPQI